MAKFVLLACALFFTMACADIVTLTDANFDDIVLDGTKDVFVKFYAPWCGHCTRMQPAWEALSNNAEKGDVVIAELNADQYRDKAMAHGVRGFPTIKFFGKNDKTGTNYQGARDEASFLSFIKQH